MQPTEGVIKFDLVYTDAESVDVENFGSLDNWRTKLHQLAMIGQDPDRYDGYGFGNVSQRIPPYKQSRGARRFLISGTQTGDQSRLGLSGYTVVEKYDVGINRVIASGPVRPSSESLTHGMIYDMDDEIRVILHVHSPAIWLSASVQGLPVTDARVPYGTPAMAREIERLFNETDVRQQQIFSMGGHEDGIVAFGRSADAAGNVLLNVHAAST
jgi:ribulose-5-phosphate 4-epimerase/fuculose-1-phosphate aldolase